MLNELWLKDYRASRTEHGNDVNKLYYHFYTSFFDLVNSLNNRSITSNKNDGVNNAQYDEAHKGYGYVSMTSGHEGKDRAAYNFCGPYGISFRDLKGLCDESGSEYSFKADVKDDAGFSQFLNLTKKGQHGPLSILAIGKLLINGQEAYFVSGGQGQSLGRYWYSKPFSDRAVYMELRE